MSKEDASNGDGVSGIWGRKGGDTPEVKVETWER